MTAPSKNIRDFFDLPPLEQRLIRNDVVLDATPITETSNKEICPECNGDRGCKNCKGVGHFPHECNCEYCDETVDCRRCDGTGDCPECGGEGLIEIEEDDDGAY